MTSIEVTNEMPLAVDLYSFDTNEAPARFTYLETLSEDESATPDLGTDNALRVTLTSSGAIILDHLIASSTEPPHIDPLVLTAPFHIPPPPSPSKKNLLPRDTTPWLVGIGIWERPKDKPDDESSLVFTREQFWHKSPQSFSLPPNSSERKILRQTTGRTSTSTNSSTATDEISSEVKAGWGPFSAAATASMSTTSQRTDTVTIRDQSSSSVVQDFVNDSNAPIVVYLWQLVERIRLSVVKPTGDSTSEEKTKVAVDSGIGPLIPMADSPIIEG